MQAVRYERGKIGGLRLITESELSFINQRLQTRGLEEHWVKPERDYSGVPTSHLAAIYMAHVDVDHATFAERIGMPERQLKSIVHHQEYAWVGLANADRIIMGLGLPSSVIGSDELPIVPGGSNLDFAAGRMARDEMYATISSEINAPVEYDPAIEAEIEALLAERISDAEVAARKADLLALREQYCTLTPEQRERLDRDHERSKKRMRKKQSVADAA